MLHTMRALFPSLTMSNREELADELDFRDFDADFVFFWKKEEEEENEMFVNNNKIQQIK